MMSKTTAPIFEVKATGSSGEIEGYASTFGGEPDSYGDIIAEGAFSESLESWKSKERLPAMLWQHDQNEPIGRWTDMSEDSKGLTVRGKVNMNVPEAVRAYEHLKAGDIDGLSIGFRLQSYEVDEDEPGIWTLTKIDLREVSVVSSPANENATVANVKASRAVHEAIDKLKAGDRLTEREFEAICKGLAGLSNSQAERAARIHLKGPRDLGKAASPSAGDLLKALSQ